MKLKRLKVIKLLKSFSKPDCTWFKVRSGRILPESEYSTDENHPPGQSKLKKSNSIRIPSGLLKLCRGNGAYLSASCGPDAPALGEITGDCGRRRIVKCGFYRGTRSRVDVFLNILPPWLWGFKGSRRWITFWPWLNSWFSAHFQGFPFSMDYCNCCWDLKQI